VKLQIFMKCVLSLGLFFMLLGCGSTPVVRSTTDTGLSPELQDLLELVNEARARGQDCGAQGVFAATTPLTIQPQLITAAQKHSTDLDAAKTTKDLHVTPVGAVNYPPGTTFTERVDAENYPWGMVGENVAYKFATPELVMKAWLASPGHCKNILNPKFSELGLGKAGDYWTQVFATPL
jgi:uncharacterized protein YkwD